MPFGQDNHLLPTRAPDAPKDLHEARAWLPVVAMAWRQPKREECPFLVHDALRIEASEPAHGGLAPCRDALAALSVAMR